MQSYDENNNVIRTQLLKDLVKNSEASDPFDQIRQEMNDPEVKYVKIGEIPGRGQEIEINGLRYRVIMSNAKKRRFTVELI